jgi:hypothetical protein
MLALVTVQVVACDLLLSDECDRAVQTQDQGTDHPQAPCDSCVCCCAHATVAAAFVFFQETIVIQAPASDLERDPLTAPSSI